MERRIISGASATLVGVATISILVIPPKPLREQPAPDAPEAVDVVQHVAAGHGFVTTAENGRIGPSRYPPGFTLALLPFAFVPSGEALVTRIQRATRVYSALYVLASAAAAWSIGGAVAGAIAGVVAGVSPFARSEAALVMSDALAAGLTIALLPLLAWPTRRGAAFSGLLIGLIVTIRLQGVILIPAALLALPAPLRRSMLTALAVPLLGLAVYFAAAFGSPFRTGYQYYLAGAPMFHPAFALAPRGVDGPWVIADRFGGLLFQWTCPCPHDAPEAALSNLVFYPAVLIGLFWVFAPPPVALLGAWRCWTDRRAPGARFTVGLSTMTVAFFVTYHYQSSRFMAAPAALLSIYGSVAIASWMQTYADTL